eukprot:142347-Prymnesium_polylepis.1
MAAPAPAALAAPLGLGATAPGAGALAAPPGLATTAPGAEELTASLAAPRGLAVATFCRS